MASRSHLHPQSRCRGSSLDSAGELRRSRCRGSSLGRAGELRWSRRVSLPRQRRMGGGELRWSRGVSLLRQKRMGRARWQARALRR